MRLLDDGHRAAHGHRLRRRPGNRSRAPDLKPGSPTSSPPNRQSTPAHCELAIPVVSELRRTPSRRAEATVERRATARGLVEFIKTAATARARGANAAALAARKATVRRTTEDDRSSVARWRSSLPSLSATSPIV